nr:GAF domain-containing protein [Oscillochloris sp. ZM17-4]
MARLGLLDHPSDPALDRLTKLTARLLRAPVALVTLVTADRQYLKGMYGLDAPLAVSRETPISHSFCQHVVASGAPLVVANAPEHPLVCDNPAIREMGLIAYLGLPLRTSDGTILGALCAIDHSPREWDEDDLAMLTDLRDTAETEIALRQEVVERSRFTQYQIAQRSTFDQIAAGGPRDVLLGTLACGIEGQIAGARCAIMLLDDSRLHLTTAAAPSLPPSYCRVIDGTRIGPRAGSCGTAAFLGKPVVVADIAIDPLWVPWRDLTIGHGLRACWSIPIFDSAGRTLGTFAIYHGEPCQPTEAEFDLVLGAANVVAVAVERWRTIDALRSSEARLRRSEANLAAVFEHTSDAIWSVDADLQVVTVNRRAVAKLREMSGTFITLNRVFDEGMPDSQRVFWRGLYRRALSGERFSIEQPYMADGAQRWCEISLNPIYDDDVIGGISVFSRDLTERKRAEAARLAMERSWQETQRLESLGVLAGGIAHDFNNLLATILGNTELAMLDVDEQVSLRESLEQVSLAARRAAEMTQQILAYAGKGRVTVEEISINAMVREMAALLRGTKLRQTPISYCLSDDLPTVAGDPAQLRQVVMNLLVNAAEAVGDGQGDIRVATDVRVIDADTSRGFEPPPPPGRYICLEVRDSGSGMSRPTLGRIFEPFFTTKFTGRGLGLAAVQGIVRGHHGAMHVESALGEGTTFSVLLPDVSQSVGHEASAAGERSRPLPLGEASGLVLVADDEPAVLQFTARLLRRLGYEPLVAASHAEALALLQSRHGEVRCVLLDWTMPGVSGEESFRRLRAQDAQTPIVVMSGYSERAVADAIMVPAPTGFLHKPFTAEALQRAIAQAVGA